MSDKKIFFMELNESSKEEPNQKKEIQKEVEDIAIDKAIDKLFDKVQVLDISGGMATIAMPIEMLKILKIFSKLLTNAQEIGGQDNVR
jgi:hypothetical protein